MSTTPNILLGALLSACGVSEKQEDDCTGLTHQDIADAERAEEISPEHSRYLDCVPELIDDGITKNNISQISKGLLLINTVEDLKNHPHGGELTKWYHKALTGVVEGDFTLEEKMTTSDLASNVMTFKNKEIRFLEALYETSQFFAGAALIQGGSMDLSQKISLGQSKDKAEKAIREICDSATDVEEVLTASQSDVCEAVVRIEYGARIKNNP